MNINVSVDIEDVIREVLSPYITTYAPPLPERYLLPNILVQQVGGEDDQTIDTFGVTLDCRAKTEAEAKETMNKAVGILKEIAAQQTSALRYVTVNSSGSWGRDPVRPDLSMCTARLQVVAHQQTMEVNKNGE